MAKAKNSEVQGEGDYQAARRYRKRTSEYLAGHDITREADKAAPRSQGEAESLQAAEAAGKRRAKGEDPALRRRSPQAVKKRR
jgi:hypothetical protein